MKPCRLHILGASGTGTSTLGRAMADVWSVPFHDTDDYFWQPTEPPYRDQRDPAQRLALMRQIFAPRRAWVLSGSMIGWGDALVPELDCVVFLTLDPALRLARLRAREASRYGPASVAPCGAYHAGHMAFMDWAKGYDDPSFNGRSLRRHNAWLDAIPTPVLRLDAALPTAQLVAHLLAA